MAKKEWVRAYDGTKGKTIAIGCLDYEKDKNGKDIVVLNKTIHQKDIMRMYPGFGTSTEVFVNYQFDLMRVTVNYPDDQKVIWESTTKNIKEFGKQDDKNNGDPQIFLTMKHWTVVYNNIKIDPCFTKKPELPVPPKPNEQLMLF